MPCHLVGLECCSCFENFLLGHSFTIFNTWQCYIIVIFSSYCFPFSFIIHCVLVKPYANNSELSYYPTLCYTTDTILPGLGYALGEHFWRRYAPPAVRQESSPPRFSALLHSLFLLCPARCLIVRPCADNYELSYTTTLFYTADTILPGLG